VVEPRFPQPLRATDNSIQRETQNISRQQRHQVLSSGIKGERGAGQVKTVEGLQAGKRPIQLALADRNWALPRVMDSLWISDELFTVRWLV
jgi:hypothetical protein